MKNHSFIPHNLFVESLKNRSLHWLCEVVTRHLLRWYLDQLDQSTLNVVVNQEESYLDEPGGLCLSVPIFHQRHAGNVVLLNKNRETRISLVPQPVR